MKIINKAFLAEQEKQNNIISQLNAQLQPLADKLHSLKEKQKLAIDECNEIVRKLITDSVTLKCNVSATFSESYGTLTISVAHPKAKDNHHPEFEIDFDEEGKMGNLERISFDLRFYEDEPYSQTESLELIMIAGFIAKQIEGNTSDWKLNIQKCFLYLRKNQQEIDNLEEQIPELQTQILAERQGIVKFETEMHMMAGNSILSVKHHIKTRDWEPDHIYSFIESYLYIINGVARTTCNITRTNTEHKEIRGKEKPEPEKLCDYGTDTPRQSIEDFLADRTTEVVNKDAILILLDKNETQQLRTNQNGKMADKTVAKQIVEVLHKESELAKTTEREKSRKEQVNLEPYDKP